MIYGKIFSVENKKEINRQIKYQNYRNEIKLGKIFSDTTVKEKNITIGNSHTHDVKVQKKVIKRKTNAPSVYDKFRKKEQFKILCYISLVTIVIIAIVVLMVFIIKGLL